MVHDRRSGKGSSWWKCWGLRGLPLWFSVIVVYTIIIIIEVVVVVVLGFRHSRSILPALLLVEIFGKGGWGNRIGRIVVAWFFVILIIFGSIFGFLRIRGINIAV